MSPADLYFLLVLLTPTEQPNALAPFGPYRDMGACEATREAVISSRVGRDPQALALPCGPWGPTVEAYPDFRWLWKERLGLRHIDPLPRMENENPR